MPISIQQISYIHPDKEVLFSDLNFAISKGQKLGLVGNNGCGKSTLLQIIAGQLSPSSGVIVRPDDIYYIPQHFGQYDSLTIAQALRIDRKQQALQAILAGDASTENFNQLDDDWNIEERSIAALDSWGLGQFPLSYPMHLLSGGEKTRVFLAGMDIHNPSVILMDEPTNGMDIPSKSQFRKVIASGMNEQKSIVISTHQVRDLENMIDHITILDNGLLLLDADTHTISSRLRFIKGGNQSEIAGAFYKVSTIAGYSAILPNETDEESLIDIEMLFNCTIGDPEVIHNIFNSSAK